MSHYFRIVKLLGPSLSDFALLVQRSAWRDFEDAEELESLVVRRDARGLRIVGNGAGPACDLWMSPAKTLYLARAAGPMAGLWVGTAAPGGAYAWSRSAGVVSEWGTPVDGVWGLADDLVFAWGGHPLTGGGAPAPPEATWVHDGVRWRATPSPARIRAVHGLDRSGIFAAGSNGRLALWTGSGWRAVESPGGVSLGFVHAVSVDEAYAASRDGIVLEGSAHGWREVARGPAGARGLWKWRHDLVLAHPVDGLSTVVKGRVVPLHPMTRAFLLTGTAEGGVMWVAESGLVASRDGLGFEELRDTELETLLDAEHAPD